MQVYTCYRLSQVSSLTEGPATHCEAHILSVIESAMAVFYCKGPAFYYSKVLHRMESPSVEIIYVIILFVPLGQLSL